MNAYEFIIKMKDFAQSKIRQLGRSVGATDNKIQKADRSTNRWSSTLRSFAKVALVAFSINAISSFVGKVIEARSEHEKFQAVLTNTFQSEAVGSGALNMLTDFAAKTPFQLNELTGSFVKLVNRGFVPTREELTKMGDLAASQGKSFDQLTEAVLDAQTGEFERLKEFGIKASKSGNQVALSFKGVTKNVENNADAIRGALLEYGNMVGVSGSMSAISKTLGGRISNLKDTWNNFLVAVGGQSSGVFNGVIDVINTGLAFLTTHLPQISKWFEILWSFISPVVDALKEFQLATFGFSSAGDAVGAFGNILVGVLSFVDIFTTGLTTLIGWLTPFADVIGVVTGAWALFNLVVALSPVGWIIIGIMALITVIGLVTKYTSGWGDSWRHTINGAKLLFSAYTEFVKANFNTLIQGLMIGIDKIKLGWFKFKEAVGIGDSATNQQIIADIANSVEQRKKSIQEGYQKMAQTALKAKEEFSKVGITVDKEGIKKDFQALKDKFKGLGQRDTSTKAFDDFQKNQKLGPTAPKPSTGGPGGKKPKSSGIVAGGARKTNITINIEKLQDQININVSNAEKGVKDMGAKVREEILRAVNSANELQTT